MSTDIDRRYAGLPPTDAYRGGHAVETTAALDFAEETVREAQGSRRRAWIVTVILIVICGAQAAAIAIMLPLKEVVPYTILVDKQTGYMETVRGIETGALQDDQAVVSSFLAQYVLQRETFDPADFDERYRRVALWSADDARNAYVQSYRAGGPDSILSGMRPGTLITTTVKHIEILTANTARVRFDLTRRDPGADPATADWQALISFRFTGAPMRMEDRLINPLGFQVTGYRRDGEWAAPAAPALPPVADLKGTAPDVAAAPSLTIPPPASAPERTEIGPTP